jgi:hypothetical protein
MTLFTRRLWRINRRNKELINKELRIKELRINK